MENKELDVREEITKIEDKIGKSMVNYSQEEIQACKKQIRTMMMQLEDALNNYGKISKSDIAKAIEKVELEFSDLVKKEIVSTRQNEYMETRKNLLGVKGSKSSIDEEMEVFKQNGIVSNDRQYVRVVDEICERLATSFKRKFQDVRDYKAEETVYDINRAIKRTGTTLSDIHVDYSDTIRRAAIKECENLQIQLDDGTREKIESRINEIAQKHGLISPEQTSSASENAEKQKIEEAIKPAVDNFNKFAASLQEGRASDAEIAAIDVEELSENKPEIKKVPELGESIPKL